jgi:hypothetical protein
VGLARNTYAPVFRVEAGGEDITAVIRERLISLSITDEAGMQSDALSLTLSDGAPHVVLPTTGAELRVWLGYGDSAQYMGLYVVDGVTLSGPPQVLSITASGAPFERSGTYTQLQTQRTRSWTPGTLGELARVVAAEHGLTPAIAAEVEGRRLGHIDQIRESDVNLVTRLAAEMGVLAKVGGGFLVLTPKAAGKAVSGAPLARVRLSPGDVTSWRVEMAERGDYRRVVAQWRDTDSACDREESVGDGEPVYRLRHPYASRDAAEQAARAKLEAFQRGRATLSLTLPGRPDLRAEALAQLEGFREGLSGQWTVTKAEHKLDSSGYVTSVDGEQGQDAATPA